MAASEKDIWDKAKSAATSISLIAVPILVAWVGTGIERSTKEAEIRLKTVEVAVGILQSPPVEGEQTSLRAWAIDVVDQYSGVRMPQPAREVLLRFALPTTPRRQDFQFTDRLTLSKGDAVTSAIMPRNLILSLGGADETGARISVRNLDNGEVSVLPIPWGETRRIGDSQCHLKPTEMVDLDHADIEVICTSAETPGSIF